MAVNKVLLSVAGAMFGVSDDRLTTLEKVGVGLLVGLVASWVVNKVGEGRPEGGDDAHAVTGGPPVQ